MHSATLPFPFFFVPREKTPDEMIEMFGTIFEIRLVTSLVEKTFLWQYHNAQGTHLSHISHVRYPSYFSEP